MLKLSLPHDRVLRLEYMKRMFPMAVGNYLGAELQGGRTSALRRLNTVDYVAYARNRNFINGSVTKLSPYIRHGCISLKEAADNARASAGKDAEKFLFELAWRDYWRRVWYIKGNAIFSDLEDAMVQLGDKLMPDFIRQGITGLPCMDGFIRDLTHTGYVHNHARLWFAAYVVHWLKVDWREAADWFENHLLDGDKASNHLSWQWVASHNSSKPYFFNKENLARFTGEKFCGNCKVKCPFDASYEEIEQKLFSYSEPSVAKERRVNMPEKAPMSTNQALAVYVSDEMLSSLHPLLTENLPSIFVFDDLLHGRWPLKRLQFVADCLVQMPEVEVWVGDTRAVLNEKKIGKLITQNTPNLQLKAILEPYNPKYETEHALGLSLVNMELKERHLQRFSHYWGKVSQELTEQMPSADSK